MIKFYVSNFVNIIKRRTYLAAPRPSLILLALMSNADSIAGEEEDAEEAEEEEEGEEWDLMEGRGRGDREGCFLGITGPRPRQTDLNRQERTNFVDISSINIISYTTILFLVLRETQKQNALLCFLVA